MCNLSEGIYERGIERGIEQGRKLALVGIIRNMLSQEYDVDVLAWALNEPAEFMQKVKTILVKNPMLSDEDIVENYL